MGASNGSDFSLLPCSLLAAVRSVFEPNRFGGQIDDFRIDLATA